MARTAGTVLTARMAGTVSTVAMASMASTESDDPAGLLPDEVALEELGYSPQMIERIMAIRAAEPQPEPFPTPLKPVIRTFTRDAAGNPVITRTA